MDHPFWPGNENKGQMRWIGFEAPARLERHEFGVSWQDVIPGGVVVVGNQIDVMLDLEAVLLTELTMLSDGEVLDVPGHPRVIATPGHTPGHCSLLLADRGVLLSGDALTTFDATARTRGPRLPSINAEGQQALASLSRLEHTDTTTVLPGHGAPWRRSIAAAVSRARDHAA